MKTRFRLLIVGTVAAATMALVPSAQAGSSDHCLIIRNDPISCQIVCNVQHIAAGDVWNLHECQSA